MYVWKQSALRDAIKARDSSPYTAGGISNSNNRLKNRQSSLLFSPRNVSKYEWGKGESGANNESFDELMKSDKWR